MTKKDKIPNTIFNTILDDIKQGKLNSGDALPSQKELCIKYDTSRGSVREALSALEMIGIIDIRPGIGAFVKKLTINSFFNPVKLDFKPDDELILDLLSFRELFETIIAKEAVVRATDTDIKNLEENLALTKFYIERDNIKKFVQLDYEFHEKLSESSHNKIIHSIFEIIFPLLKYTITEILVKTAQYPDVMKKSYDHHKEIIDSIIKKNSQKAIDGITKHLEFVKGNYKKISSDK